MNIMSLATAVILSLTLALVSAGSLEPRIIEGQHAKQNQFPYVVSIRYSDNNSHFCAGTIITPSWVLTAAHCFDDYCSDCKPEDVVVVTGALNEQVKGFQTPVKTIKLPEVHQSKDPWNADIALIQAEKPLFNVDSNSVIPRSILSILGQNVNNFLNKHVLSYIKENLPRDPFKKTKKIIKFDRIGNNVEVIVPGWGKESKDSDNVSDELLYTSFWTIDSNKCCRNNISVICAEGLDESGVCTGDSGGPVIVQNKGKDVLVGITDGRSCNADYPVKFIRVYPSRKWILDQIPNAKEHEEEYLA